MEENNNMSTEQAAEVIAKVRASKKFIYGLSIALIVIIIGILAGMMIYQNGSKKADQLVGKADMEQNDSIATELYKEAAKAGYKSGSRANIELGTRAFRDGKYEEALKYLKESSAADEVVAAGVYALEGDCYVNLDNNADALKCYDKAISAANGNPQIVPVFLIKKANIYRAEGKYADEAKAYKTILDDYPRYVQASAQVDIRKYYERAKAAAGE